MSRSQRSVPGGTLVGVLSALLRFFEDSYETVLVPDLTRLLGPWLASWSNWMGLAAFALLGGRLLGLEAGAPRPRDGVSPLATLLRDYS